MRPEILLEPKEGFDFKPLTPEEVEKFIDLRKVNYFLYETEYCKRLGYYHAKQNNFFRSNKPTKMGCGGNMSGKTKMAMRGAAMYSKDEYYYYDRDGEVKRRRIGREKSIWIFSPSFKTHKDSTQAHFMQYFEDDEIKDVKWNDKASGILSGFTVVKTDTRIEFKTYEMTRENLQGARLDLVIFDEEPPERIYDEILMREKAGEMLEIWFSFTPLKGKTWAYYRVYMSTNTEDIYTDTMGWNDNPFLSEEQKARKRRGLSKEELVSREHGMFADSSKAVCGWFGRDTHMIDPDDIPLNACTLYISADFGWNPDPSVVLLIAVDVKQNIYVFDAIKELRMQGEELALVTKQKLGLKMISMGVGDSANPDKMAAFTNEGFAMIGVDKHIYKDMTNTTFNSKTWDRCMASSMEYFGEIREGSGKPKLFISSAITEYDSDKGAYVPWLAEELESLNWKQKSGKKGTEDLDNWDDHRLFNHHFDGVFALAYFCVMFRKIGDSIARSYDVRKADKPSGRRRRKYYTR